MAWAVVGIGSLRLIPGRSGLALLNTASPWASEKDQLRSLYAADTSAITTRTAVVKEAHETEEGFDEDPDVHTVRFIGDGPATWSLNSYGYSPHPLQYYLDIAAQLLAQQKTKPIILSITGTPVAVAQGVGRIRRWADLRIDDAEARVGIEINLSCPNIKGQQRPAGSDAEGIRAYLKALKRERRGRFLASDSLPRLALGLKMPPYTSEGPIDAIVRMFDEEMDDHGETSYEDEEPPQYVISFLTLTNTLGNALWLDPTSLEPVLPARDGQKGFGGLAGPALHPLALGNVRRFRMLLDARLAGRVQAIKIIGAGGVDSALAAQRMIKAGACVAGVATALGQQGVGVFGALHDECEASKSVGSERYGV